jgi:monofunctional biosynthetic peptidoglycan transglycosylase
VIASEDAGFADHGGVDWDAIEKAWDTQPARRSACREPLDETRHAPPVPSWWAARRSASNWPRTCSCPARRTVLRKAQELAAHLMLEALLSKQRILEIYLNHVEWGEGVFGAQAAARHYFRVDASRLGVEQAARLAVMLPAPKRFEKLPGSAYVAGRSRHHRGAHGRGHAAMIETPGGAT